MTKKDFFVIIESDNLYLDLTPCSGYVVLDTIGIYKNPHNDFTLVDLFTGLEYTITYPTLKQARNIAENLAPVSREQRKSKDAKRWNAIYKNLLDERAQ